jgi:BMFP domain-containing protein YqiC
MKIIMMTIAAVFLLTSPVLSDNSFKDTAKKIQRDVKEGVQEAGSDIKKFGKETGEAVKKDSQEAGEKMRQDAKEAARDAKKAGRGMGDWFRNFGRNIKRFFTGD